LAWWTAWFADWGLAKDARFGFVIQFLIIFMLATSSKNSVTSRHATCTTMLPLDGASQPHYSKDFLLALKSLRPQQGAEQVTQQTGSDKGGE
jgi:hypothetical protein